MNGRTLRVFLPIGPGLAVAAIRVTPWFRSERMGNLQGRRWANAGFAVSLAFFLDLVALELGGRFGS